MGKNYSKKESVVVLPYRENKVLLQLRAFTPNIAYPGVWGFFGGSIKKGETYYDAARRELYEETSYMPNLLHKLEVDKVKELDNVILYSYYCKLSISESEIILNEGSDFGLFTLEEVLTNTLYSKTIKKKFPIIHSSYVSEKIRSLWIHLKKSEVIF